MSVSDFLTERMRQYPTFDITATSQRRLDEFFLPRDDEIARINPSEVTGAQNFHAQRGGINVMTPWLSDVMEESGFTLLQFCAGRRTVTIGH